MSQDDQQQLSQFIDQVPKLQQLAKQTWGEALFPTLEGIKRKDFRKKPNWQIHLRELVISDDPEGYFEENVL